MGRKIICIIVLAMLLCFSACGKEPEHYVLEAKTDAYNSLEEVENGSEVIVKGIRQAEEEPYITKENGVVVSGYTFSEFEITEIFKDTSDTLQIGDNIKILENEVYDEEENIVYHVAGYNMMEEGKEYLLFLTKHTLNNSDYYVSLGVNYGTVSLEEDNRMTQRKTKDGVGMGYDDYKIIWDAAKEEYVEK